MTSGQERIIAVAIVRAGALTRTTGQNKHAFLRQLFEHRGEASTLPNDEEGFVTSAQRYVDALEAKAIAIAAGQVQGTAAEGLTLADLGW